ncbi:LysR family transcriptional regulator [Celerinatantimonas sp. YJH-8]|uniref:LysR family transcriptional regulator n=1 Tax=Celerinatantimonas sp. YJH-8 TaxID=3228714 RepID=UPI0038C3B4DA
MPDTNKSIGLLYEMAVFVSVVETGSFSAAAKDLGVSPSSVSRSVSRLEEQLACRLLERTTRKLRLNEAGQAVYQRCRDMRGAAEAVLDVSERINPKPQGELRISIPKAIGHLLVHPFMPEFLRQYPDIDVQMLLEDRYIDLIDDRVDLVIRITNHPPQDMVGRKLIDIEHVICASPQYLEQFAPLTHPRQLREHSCIFLGEQPKDRQWTFHQGTQNITVEISGRYAANHTQVRLDAAIQGIGIASLPYFSVHQAIRRGELIQVLPDWRFVTSYTGGAWLLYPPNRYLPAKLKVFIDYLTKSLSRLPQIPPALKKTDHENRASSSK